MVASIAKEFENKKKRHNQLLDVQAVVKDKKSVVSWMGFEHVVVVVVMNGRTKETTRNFDSRAINAPKRRRGPPLRFISSWLHPFLCNIAALFSWV